MENKFGDLLEKRFFKSESDSEPSEQDIQLAAAILMFEVIMSDGHVDRMEVAEMVEILRQQFALKAEKIGSILEQVRSVSGEKLHLEVFSSKLREFWNDKQRLRLLHNLWVIAFADQVIHDRERSMIDEIAYSLNLTKEDIQRAEVNAQQHIERNA